MSRDGAPHRSTVRLLCVGANRFQADLLAGALACHSDIEHVGCAEDLNRALQQAATAEIVVLQAEHLADGGLPWVWALTDARPEVQVLVVGVPRNEALVVAYVEAGATGIVTEEQDLEQLLEAIRTVHRQEGYLSPDLVPALLRRLSSLRRALIDPHTAAGRLEALTPREAEILGLLAQGCSNGSIANRLRIAVGTVKNHIHTILQKLRVSGRWEAAACLEIAGRAGCVDQTWPLGWGPWPATPEQALPIRLQEMSAGDFASGEGEADVWAAPWPDS